LTAIRPQTVRLRQPIQFVGCSFVVEHVFASGSQWQPDGKQSPGTIREKTERKLLSQGSAGEIGILSWDNCEKISAVPHKTCGSP